MPFESVESVAPQRYKELLESQDILQRYQMFTQAQNLGVVFGPKDLSATDVILFCAIREKLDESIRSKGGK